MEVTEKENTMINKDLFFLRSKMHRFITGYDKYVSKLKKNIDMLEAENQELKQW